MIERLANFYRWWLFEAGPNVAAWITVLMGLYLAIAVAFNLVSMRRYRKVLGLKETR